LKTRMTNPEARIKPEVRNPKTASFVSSFGFRI